MQEPRLLRSIAFFTAPLRRPSFTHDMPPQLHAHVQDANDLDETRLKGAIEDHMHRVRNSRFPAFFPAMANVEATNAWKEASAIRGQRTFRFGCDTAHCGREESAIPNASL